MDKGDPYSLTEERITLENRLGIKDIHLWCVASIIKGLRMGFVLFVSSQGKIVEGNIILLLEYVLNIQCDTPTLFPSSTGGSQSALFNFTPVRTPLKFRPLREEIAPSM